VKLHIDSGHDAGAMWFAYSTVYSSPDGSGWYSLVIIEKNGFFFNAPHGAKASATIYSVIETAKKNGLNPFKYLTDLLEQLPQLANPKDPVELDELLPWSPSLPLTCRLFQSN
jgi:hypothetical protein